MFSREGRLWRMKVFISWSGENSASHKIAIALRDWLPCVINCVKPFVSSEDISKGDRGLLVIEESLKDSGFGIICVTKENFKAPWLLFEAGALSHNPDKIPVTPFLFGLSPSDLSGSPLSQLQATMYLNKDDIEDDIKKLIKALNTACGGIGVPDSILDRTFEKWYPDLKENLAKISKEIFPSDKKKETDGDKNRAILEEILDVVRNSQKLLSSSVVEMSIDDKISSILSKPISDLESKYVFSQSRISGIESRSLRYNDTTDDSTLKIARKVKRIIQQNKEGRLNNSQTMDILFTYFSPESSAMKFILEDNYYKPAFVKVLGNLYIYSLQKWILEIDPDYENLKGWE